MLGVNVLDLTQDHVAYFDNAATTFPKPEQVYTFMDSFYRGYGVNVSRGKNKLAFTAGSVMNETRQLLLDLFHCPAKKVLFTSTSTVALNTVLLGLNWQNGMNVYITPFEHNSVYRPLFHIQNSKKINIIQLTADKKCLQYDLQKIKLQFLKNKPHVVVMSQASNVCGLVAPVKEICDLAKMFNAITVLDLSQSAGLIDIDLTSVQADYAIFAGHKTLYGPFGVSGFISGQAEQLKPLIYGGTGIDSANPNLPEQLPERFEAGSINIAAISGLHAALTWLNKIGIKEILAKEEKNTKRLIDLLKRYDNIKLIVPQGEHIGVVSCVFDNYASDNIGQVLSDHNIAVRTGLHCAPLAHKFLGTFPAGTVRFSISYFTQEQDFEQLKEALDYIAENS